MKIKNIKEKNITISEEKNVCSRLDELESNFKNLVKTIWKFAKVVETVAEVIYEIRGNDRNKIID